MHVRIYMYVMYVLYMYVRKNGESKSTYSTVRASFLLSTSSWAKHALVDIIDKKNTNVRLSTGH